MLDRFDPRDDDSRSRGSAYERHRGSRGSRARQRSRRLETGMRSAGRDRCAISASGLPSSRTTSACLPRHRANLPYAASPAAGQGGHDLLNHSSIGDHGHDAAAVLDPLQRVARQQYEIRLEPSSDRSNAVGSTKEGRTARRSGLQCLGRGQPRAHHQGQLFVCRVSREHERVVHVCAEGDRNAWLQQPGAGSPMRAGGTPAHLLRPRQRKPGTTAP